jgi:hypothetical protein
MSTVTASKTFTRWTEEERRAHRRAQNAKYQARKVEYLTDRQKQIKEEERKKRQETKQAMEQGAWVTVTVKVEKKEKEKEKEKKVVKNGFAALESDEEEEIKLVTKKLDTPDTIWRKTKIDWAAESDDE